MIKSFFTLRQLYIAYTIILCVYFLMFGEAWLSFLGWPQISILPTMTLGSFVAGSTFLGGGAIAFPVLTKFLNLPPDTAKTFSLAIQSVGMTSASVWIICSAKELPWRLIVSFSAFSFAGIAFSLTILENLISPDDLRIGFSLFILCFVVAMIFAGKQRLTPNTPLAKGAKHELILIGFFGFIGGIFSGLIGSGADLMAFCLMTLYYKQALRISIQSSVIVMAATSVVGISLQAWAFNEIGSATKTLWVLAAPVVLIGAPLGAWFCVRVKPKALSIFIYLIAFVEITSTVLLVPIAPTRILVYLCLVLIFCSVLFATHQLAKKPSEKPFTARSER